MLGSADLQADHEVMSQLETSGWTMLSKVFQESGLADLREATSQLTQLQDEAVRSKSGDVYAARNLLQLCPQVLTAWRVPRLLQLVRQVCGPEAGLVRGLFFDKPPDQTWALPWHKDLLIAVADETHCNGYSRPRLRAGVWHTEPPLEVLQSMLTLRIHLDAMTPDNGPLHVLSGSHTTGKELRAAGFDEVQLHCAAGDVLAMRPLLVHSSNRSRPECTEHRRIIHLEFSGMSQLPGGAKWHTFEPVR